MGDKNNVDHIDSEKQIINHYRSQLKIDYDIDATLIPYAGECDLNFGLSDNNKNIFAFLKVMHEGCSIDYVMMQIEAINICYNNKCQVPYVFKNKQESYYSIWNNKIVFIISALSGVTLADFKPHTCNLMKDIGISLGNITKVLKENQFNHEGLNKKHNKWHPLNPHWALRKENIQLLKDDMEDMNKNQDHEELYQICQESLEYFINHCEKQLITMEEACIHCDANDYNIIIKTLDVDKGPELSGICDFGDMTYAPVVCDVAIGAAYVVLGKNIESPIELLVSFVQGYNQSWPLSDEELALIFPLVCTRLAVSLVNSAMMKREKPNDPYVTISAQPARNFLLSKAKALSRASVEQRLRMALGRPVIPNAESVSLVT